MSSTVPVAYKLLKHVLSLLVTCPPSHQFQRLLLCVGLSTCIFARELIELTELAENLVLVMGLFFPGGFFLVAHSTNCVGEGDSTQLPPLNPTSCCLGARSHLTS